METFREEILPDVWLTSLHTNRFKTACLSSTLLTQLSRDTAADNALIPYVLRRGTRYHTDMQALSNHLDGLYGAWMEPHVEKRGEIQCLGLYAGFCDDAFLPAGEEVARKVAGTMGEMLLQPFTRGGLLLPDYVEGEKQQMLERQEAAVNDKRSWSIRRMLETMCAYEDYSVQAIGSESETENIHYVNLTKHYKQLLAASPMELFYCGSTDPKRMADYLRGALSALSRGEINYDLGTEVRMNALEAEPRFITEEMEVAQGNLALGFRLGDCMEDPDPAAIRLFNAIYGGTVSSKLFMNVREKLSLCYYASSMIDLYKGILAVSSGIAFDKYDAALNEILSQLDDMRHGTITEEEFLSAKRTLQNSYRSVPDDPHSLESFYMNQTVLGLEYGPLELAELIEDVTVDDIVSIASGVELDTVYFLKGEEAE